VKVCLIGHTRGPRDEGMKNINRHLVAELRDRVSLLVVEPQECRSPRGWGKIRDFRPDIITYLQGPTIRSLVLGRFLRSVFRPAKIVLLASNPALNGKWDRFLPFLAPHLVLAVSRAFQQRMARAGIPCELVCPGVDQAVFKPVDAPTKRKLRGSMGLPLDTKIVLQVGHLTEVRGVRVLGDLQKALEDRVRFVAVSSATNRPQAEVVAALQGAGVKVILDFVPHIEQLYQASDAYLFPGIRVDAAIDIPLSVLEAMAVNLPVVTTRFGGLPDIFAPAPWFRYADSQKAMAAALEAVLFDERRDSRTAEMVSRFTWTAFAQKILEAYQSLNEVRETG